MFPTILAHIELSEDVFQPLILKILPAKEFDYLIHQFFYTKFPILIAAFLKELEK